MTALIACMHHYWMPGANPYLEAQTVALLLLVVGAFGWRWVAPRPSRVVSGYMIVSSIVMMCATYVETCGDVAEPAEVCGVIFKASLVLTTCIYVEIVRALRARSRLARATARYRREEVRSATRIAGAAARSTSP